MSRHRWSRMISVLTRAIVGVLLLVAGLGILYVLTKSRPEPPRVEEPDLRVHVPVFVARPVEVNRRWTGYGTARAMDSADVTAEVAGIITERPADLLAGVRVEQGDLLLRIDDSDYRQQLRTIESRLDELQASLQQLDIDHEALHEQLELVTAEREIAQRELDRVREAEKRGAARPREVDQALQQFNAAARAEAALRHEYSAIEPQRLRLEAQRRGLEAERDMVQRNIARCTIRSPLTGTVQHIHIQRGERVGIGEPLVRIVNLDRIEIPIRLQAGARSLLSIDDEVELVSSGSVPRRWHGRISRVSPDDDAATRTFTAFVVVDNKPMGGEPRFQPGIGEHLHPGMFVGATIISSRIETRYIIPRRSMRGDTILVVDNDVVATRSVTIDFEIRRSFPDFGIDDEYWVVLSDPLPNGTLVVLDGTRHLPTGTPVRPTIVGTQAEAAHALQKTFATRLVSRKRPASRFVSRRHDGITERAQ